MLNRDKAPLGNAVVWPNLIAYADEHNLVIDMKLSHKVDWMEEHNGVCFCDWDSGRYCPCGNIASDFNRYNGQCLCGLLCSKERLEQKQKQRNNKKVSVVDNELNKKKAKETRSLFKRIFKK